jgi:NADPH-dependent curcumin reductase CurA
MLPNLLRANVRSLPGAGASIAPAQQMLDAWVDTFEQWRPRERLITACEKIFMESKNRQLLVKQWPNGLPRATDFELVDGPMPVLGDAQVLIRNQFLSIDPYYRHSLGPRFLGTRFRHAGDVMMAVTLGEVVESRDPTVPVGAHVTTLLGDMQDFAAVSGRDVRVLSPEIFGAGKLPFSTALGVAGIPGLTAYAGIVAHARARPGQTFVVSSASGCVGATAGQLARLMGLRAIGIAGAPQKCAWVVESAGFDACVSYKSANFADELKSACPRGIDVNFEHVGGAVLATILPQMVYGGRLVMSGMIDQYNEAVSPPGPNWGIIIAKSLTVSGLRVFDHFAMMPEYECLVAPLILSGRFAYLEDTHDGLESAPESLARALTGGNFGKSLIRL